MRARGSPSSPTRRSTAFAGAWRRAGRRAEDASEDPSLHWGAGGAICFVKVEGP